MKLDRTVPPVIRPLGEFEIARPERMEMKNGIPLNIIHAGSQEVVRLDVLIGGGQWHQTQALQALFTNRMLREGTLSLTSKQIAEKLDYYGAWLELSSAVNYGFVTLYSLNKYFPYTLAIIADMLMQNWTDKAGIEHRGLIDKEYSEEWFDYSGITYVSTTPIDQGGITNEEVIVYINGNLYGEMYNHLWAVEGIQTHTITEDTEVDDIFGTWYIANTNYNEVNSAEPSFDSIKAKMQVLIDKSNAKTGKNDTDLYSAVESLLSLI